MTTPDPTPRADWRRVLSLARPELPTLAVGTLALVAGSGLGLVAPRGIGLLMDTVRVPEGLDAAAAEAARLAARATLDRTLFLLLGVFVLVGVFGFVRAWLFTLAGERVVARLRRDLYASVVRQEIGFFDAQRTGELVNRLAADTGVLQNSVTVNISMALRFALQAVGALAVLAWTSWRLTALMLGVVPIVVVGAVVFGRTVRSLSKQTQDALAAASAVAEETFSNMRTVRSFAREEQEISRYAARVDEAFERGRSLAVAYGSFQGLAGFAAYAAIALVLWYGGRLVIGDAGGTGMSVGDLTSFMLYTLFLAFALGGLSGLYGDFNRAVGASTRVFELLDRPPGVTTPDGARPERCDGHVVFEGVDFQYPTRADAPVLRGVDLTLAPGRVLALVGASGSGKSTVAQLLARFYDPAGGHVTLDGRDLRALDPVWLREQVGAVAQEPVLFAASLAENIRYGRPDATDAEVEAAARAANADGFVRAFPDGYATMVGERGVRLSGGQKQRVAIARALLKDPRILVLDEATSALDAESEHLVQEALERLMVGRTVLVIAHRLSTVKDADEVVVLDAGRVVERGTHASLLEADGPYRRLVERQFAS
jgi:ATP-binding cassette subfamily B protein